MYLENINSPKDIKGFDKEKLYALSGEIREALLEKLSKTGGHVGPNLGMVELTVALHYVFNSPVDKFVFDVSHQCYTHKILTGRKAGFLDEKHYKDFSGYTNPDESEHDFFKVGHTSTSLSIACGLAKARDLKKEDFNVIAIIGDGSLSGGEALEGLDNIIEQGSNTIVIVNDNEMSIAENYGGIYGNLALLRKTEGKAELNMFKALGFDYAYIKDGHSYEEIIPVLESAKDSKKPIVIHIHTIKGKGYKFAEKDKERWHYNGPFDIETGKAIYDFSGEKDFSSLTCEYLLEEMKKNKELVVVTAGTPTVMGFTKEKRELAGEQFVDVGIAEEHAVAFSSGVGKGGCKAVFGVYSTFLQRTYDQIFHDLCINNNPALMIVFAASIYGMNDVTHTGLYDISLLSSIPNLVHLAPTSLEEYMEMLDWGVKQNKHPVVIRVPAMLVESGLEDKTNYYDLNKYEMVEKGREVALLGLGTFFGLAQDVAKKLKEEKGIKATIINPKFISGLDEEMLNSLKKEHKVVITIEDGVLDGGFGEKISRFLGDSNLYVKNYGIKKGFLDRYDVNEVLKENKITLDDICEDVLKLLEK